MLNRSVPRGKAYERKGDRAKAQADYSKAEQIEAKETATPPKPK